MRWRYLLGFGVLIAVVVWGCSGCSYDGSYRYSCQDPKNWDKDECKPPLCNPSGTCTKDLIYETTPQA